MRLLPGLFVHLVPAPPGLTVQSDMQQHARQHKHQHPASAADRMTVAAAPAARRRV